MGGMSDWKPIKSAPRNGKCFILGRAGRFGFVSPAIFNNRGILQTLDCPEDPSYFGDGASTAYGELVWKPFPKQPTSHGTGVK